MQSQGLSWAQPTLRSLLGSFHPLGKAPLDTLCQCTASARWASFPHQAKAAQGFPWCSLSRRRGHSFGPWQHKNNNPPFLLHQPLLCFSETPDLHQLRIRPSLLSPEIWFSPTFVCNYSLCITEMLQICCALHAMDSLFTHVLLQARDSVSEREGTNSMLCRALTIKRSLKKKIQYMGKDLSLDRNMFQIKVRLEMTAT